MSGQGTDSVANLPGVDSTLSELSSVTRSLGNSIDDLQKKIAELAESVKDIEIPNPESDVAPPGFDDADDESKFDGADASTGLYRDSDTGDVVDSTDDKVGNLELVGGTFAISAGIHDTLKRGLRKFSGATEGEISGAGNLEVLALKKIGSAASSLIGGVEKVSKEVQEKISDIVYLRKVMSDSLSKITSALEKSSDIDSSVQVVLDVYKKLDEEFEYQISSLRKMLNHKLEPSVADLHAIMNGHSSFKTLAERLGNTYNTSEGSDRLALAYTHLSKLKNSSRKVADALKAVKMSVDTYKGFKNSSDMEKALLKFLTGSKDMEAIKAATAAIKVLKSTFKDRKGILEELENKKGSAEGGAYIGRVSAQKKDLTTRVKTYEETIKEVFKMFISQINSVFAEFRKVVESLGDDLGGEVAYNDDLKTFISIFGNLGADLQEGKVFYALVGLDKTVSGKELKNRFQSNLTESINALNPLQSNKPLKSLQMYLQEIRTIINTYNDVLVNAKKDDKKGKGDELSAQFIEQSSVLSVAKTINEAIIRLKFYGNLAMLKDNLARVSKEYPEMQEGYDKLLGKAIGARLSELQKEYVEAVDRLNDEERGRGFVLSTYNKEHPGDKIPKGLIENIYKLQYDARVGLYKTVEAIDIYLMNFTEKMSGDIVALKELNELLSQTELISAWANESSKERLEKLHNQIESEEFMNYGTAVGCSQMVTTVVKKFTSGTNIRNVLESCKQAVESIAVLRNIIAMFIKIGDKFASGSLSKDNYMSSGTMYNNLVRYVWVSCFTMGSGTAGGNGKAAIAGKQDKSKYDNETGDKAYFFDMKMTSVVSPLDLLREHEKKVKKDLKAKLEVAADDTDVNIAVSLAAANALTTEQAITLNDSAASKKSIENLIASLDGKDIFQTDDKYFVLAMKAISAKILTVVGVSNILNRPSKVTTMITNPVRSIIGAAEPTIDDSAVELYIRLPLLVEFYKDIFGDGNEEFKKNDAVDNNEETIAFIPELGSKWSGLIQCIFDDSRQIKSGIYSVENMKTIISEVNNIKSTYPADENARKIAVDLINEINRRYGVMKKKDIGDFYQSKKKYTSAGDIEYRDDFDILDPADADSDYAGPSTNFVKESFELQEAKTSTSQDDMSIVKKFRDLIRKKLYSQDFKDLTDKSFDERIKFFKKQVANAKNDNEKLETIIKAIDESSDVSNFNTDVLVAYHELVQFPLAVLDKMYSFNFAAVRNIIVSANMSNRQDHSQRSQLAVAVVCVDKVNELKDLVEKRPDEFLEFMQVIEKIKIKKETISSISTIITPSRVVKTKLDNLLVEADKVIVLYKKSPYHEINNEIADSEFFINLMKLNEEHDKLLEHIDGFSVSKLIHRGKDHEGDVAAMNAIYAAKKNVFTKILDLNSKDIEVMKLDIARRGDSEASKYLLAILNNFKASSKHIDTGVIEKVIANAKDDLVEAVRGIKDTILKTFGKIEKFTEEAGHHAQEIIRKIEGKPDAEINKEFIQSISDLVKEHNNVLTAATHWKDFAKSKRSSGKVLSTADINKLSNIIKEFTESSKPEADKLRLASLILSENGNDDFAEMLNKVANKGNDDEISIMIDAMHNRMMFTKCTLMSYILDKFGCDAVSIKYLSNGKYVIDYSKLQSHVEKTLQLAKLASSKYRHLVSSELSLSTDKVISMLENKYLHNLIYSQDTEKDSVFNAFNFEKLNSSISTIVDMIDRSSEVDVSYRQILNIKRNDCFTVEKAADSNRFSRVLIECMKTYDEKKRIWTAEPNEKIEICSSIYSKTNTGSLLSKFNSLVARYLDTFFEESTKKFYVPLVAELCKSQSTCVYSGIGLKDMNDPTDDKSVAAGSISENDHVLAESLGYCIKVLTTRDLVKQIDKKFYAVSHIEDVSVNMVDRYLNFLPYFKRLFNKILTDSIAYKKMVESLDSSLFTSSSIGKYVLSKPVLLNGNSVGDMVEFSGKLTTRDSNIQPHITNTLSNLIEACRSIITDCDNVLMDSESVPKHLELKGRFLANFVENFGKLPVTPVSAVMTDFDMVPSSAMSMANVKLCRGLNYALSDSKLTEFGWLKTLLTDIKNSTTKDNSVDPERALEDIKSVIMLVRCLKNFEQTNMFGANISLSTSSHSTEVKMFYLNKSMQEAVSLTETSSDENSKKILAESVTTLKRAVISRPQACLLNIIDLNVNPINPHALMREIPLINVYNYAFTFDDIISKDFEVSSDDLYKKDFVKNKKTALASLLLDPYYNVMKVYSKETVTAAATGINKDITGITDTETILRNCLTEDISVSNDLKFGIGKYVKEIGKECGSTAFNTKAVRNLIFLTNLQRLLLTKIKSEVHRVNSRKVKSTDILSDRIISYESAADSIKNDDFGLFELQ